MIEQRSLASALVWWQRAAGSYWPYVCAAPFLAQVGVPSPTLPRPGQATNDLIRIIDAAREPRTLFVADLPPRVTLAAVPELHRLGYRVVPIIQRWIVPGALVPSTSLISALTAIARPARLPSAPVRGVVLCLDGERHGRLPPLEPPPPRRFDNRYRYPVCRFPPRRFLDADGIARVHWLSMGPFADDLAVYRESLTPFLPSRDVGLDGQEAPLLG